MAAPCDMKVNLLHSCTGSGERFLGLLPLKGERDMLTDIRHTPLATEIVRLSTLLEVRCVALSACHGSDSLQR